MMLVASDPEHIEAACSAARQSDPSCEVEVLSTLEHALDWLNAVSDTRLPCLVLMDLQLPRLDNWALLRKIRLNNITADLPVLVYSSVYTQADVLLSYQAGANSFVAKPNDASQFIELYRSQLRYWLTTARQPGTYASY